MCIEIERKFLVVGNDWRTAVVKVTPVCQGYSTDRSLFRTRIRIFGDKGFISVKGPPRKQANSLVRQEFEYEIPRSDAVEMIREFRVAPLIEKVRHELVHDGRLWIIDEYQGANQGLIVAEVELDAADEPIVLPNWAGEEVTGDRRYGNSKLARLPYSRWAGRLSLEQKACPEHA